MPPINQQGSRAGLITGLVVFAILFITSAIFAFNFYGKWQADVQNYDNYKKTYNEIVNAGALDSPTVQALKAAKTESPAHLKVAPSDSVLDVAIKQRDGLAESIVGSTSEATPGAIADQAATTLKDTQGKLDKAKTNVKVPVSGLQPAVIALGNAVAQQQKTINDLTAQLRDSKAQYAAAVENTAKINAARDADVDAAHKSAADDLAKANAALDANKAVITQLQADQTAQSKAATDASQLAATDLANANQNLTKANSKVSALEGRLANRRPDVINSLVRQADGKIVRVADNGVCYINLGQGDQVTAGLTFEVYDKAEGVPAIPDNVTGDEQLPVGKASIEITHIGATSSECRIVKTAPGAVLTEGDLIENLIYDSHTKYNFFVFGNFDLSQNGRSNSADTEIVKRLVTQWGGKLIDEVNVNTDFVVLGSEPVLPTFSKDDLTAENQDKLAKAQEALDRYQEIRQEAKDLHIPIMNQNRFLYYVGFYDQSKR